MLLGKIRYLIKTEEFLLGETINRNAPEYQLLKHHTDEKLMAIYKMFLPVFESRIVIDKTDF